MKDNKTNSAVVPLVGFYWRKLVLFCGFFAVFLFTISTVNTYKADIDQYVPEFGDLDLNVTLEIKPDGSVYIDGQKFKEHVNILADKEEIRFPVLDNSGQYFDSVTINVVLPKEVASVSQYEFLGIHGVGSTETKLVDENNIKFIANDVSSAAILTPVIIMPKGTVQPPMALKAVSSAKSLRAGIWIAVGVLLPLLTLILLFTFIAYQIRRQRVDRPDYETAAPPMALPPALVGLLFHQKIGPREIAATLIDLAERKDIYIVDRERDFAFLKNKFDNRLLTYEKVLLSKIFNTKLISDKEEVDHRINNHLYSKKLSLVTAGINVLGTRLGYFKVNPQKMQMKYLAYGASGFFIGLAGFVLSLKIFSDTPYIAFFWLGMMVSALVITFMAKNIPIRTVLGQGAVSNWLAFKKFLTKNEKMPYSFHSQEMFQKYLPYAIVMDCEVAWAKRFSEQNFELPDWYVTDRDGLSLQDFCLSLFPIVSYVARSFAAIREPGFK